MTVTGAEPVRSAAALYIRRAVVIIRSTCKKFRQFSQTPSGPAVFLLGYIIVFVYEGGTYDV